MHYDGFVYIWYDRKHRRYYIGSHMGTEDDGYITSTGYMLNAYRKRPGDFRRRILEYHVGDYKSLLNKEQRWLNMIDIDQLFSVKNRAAKTIRYYNVKPTASGLSGKIASNIRKNFLASDRGKEWLQEQSERMVGNELGKGKTAWNKGKKCPSISEGIRSSDKLVWSDGRRKTHSELMKKRWAEGAYNDRPLPSAELVERRRQSQLAQHRKQTDKQKEAASRANKKIWEVKQPDGSIVVVENLSLWCKERGLYSCNVSRTGHKGYIATKKGAF